MGGTVSCAQRLRDVSSTDDALGGIYALKNSRYVLIFAPMTGAVFALVTMLLFMGGLMTGAMFPTFKDIGTAALLFLWCFISGFAERFIPDTLDPLAELPIGVHPAVFERKSIHCTFSGNAQLDNAVFHGSDLSNSVFLDAHLKDASFDRFDSTGPATI
jgi:hypothetical protein